MMAFRATGFEFTNATDFLRSNRHWSCRRTGDSTETGCSSESVADVDAVAERRMAGCDDISGMPIVGLCVPSPWRCIVVKLVDVQERAVIEQCHENMFQTSW